MTAISASHTVEIDAPLERCFEVAADVARAPEWQGTSLEEVEVVESDPEGRAIVVDAAGFSRLNPRRNRPSGLRPSENVVEKSRSTLRFHYESPNRISWEQVTGSAKSVTGMWQLDESGEGRTRATYVANIDLGWKGGLLLGPLKSYARDLYVKATREAAEGLKRRLEGGA